MLSVFSHAGKTCEFEFYIPRALSVVLIDAEDNRTGFDARARKVVADTDGIGWDFHDSLGEYYYEFYQHEQ